MQVKFLLIVLFEPLLVQEILLKGVAVRISLNALPICVTGDAKRRGACCFPGEYLNVESLLGFVLFRGVAD